MEAAAPKPEFYTPATFKKAAEQFGHMLTEASGFVWKMHGIQKSNRKTIEGQELYLSAKFYPEDKSKPSSAELSASLTSGYGRMNYLAQALVEHHMKPVFEESHNAQQFNEVAHWVSALKLPPQATASLKQAGTLTERVVNRFRRESRPV